MHDAALPVKPTLLRLVFIEYTKLEARRKKEHLPDENSQHSCTNMPDASENRLQSSQRLTSLHLYYIHYIYILCDPLEISVNGVHIDCVADSKNQLETQ
jgi:hypothetical protein